MCRSRIRRVHQREGSSAAWRMLDRSPRLGVVRVRCASRPNHFADLFEGCRKRLETDGALRSAATSRQLTPRRSTRCLVAAGNDFEVVVDYVLGANHCRFHPFLLLDTNKTAVFWSKYKLQRRD